MEIWGQFKLDSTLTLTYVTADFKQAKVFEQILEVSTKIKLNNSTYGTRNDCTPRSYYYLTKREKKMALV